MAEVGLARLRKADLEVRGQLTGMAAVVTGASSGIGVNIAKGLAAAGAEVGLVCRNPELGEATRNAIIAATGNKALRVFRADLSVQADIRRVAIEIAEAYPRIAVLMNNAGTAEWRRSQTPDGIETTFAVNHLAPFLLTHLLLENVKAAAPSRIITVASSAHYRARMDFNNLQSRRRYFVWHAYSRSKLANILFTRELAKQLKGTGVVANCVHPGVVNTRIWRVNAFIRLVAPLVERFLLNPEAGAATPLHAALDVSAGEVTGVYFTDCKPKATSRAAEDEIAMHRLWEVSKRLTGLATTGSNTI